MGVRNHNHLKGHAKCGTSVKITGWSTGADGGSSSGPVSEVTISVINEGTNTTDGREGHFFALGY
jgi:hypothetical protein